MYERVSTAQHVTGINHDSKITDLFTVFLFTLKFVSIGGRADKIISFLLQLAGIKIYIQFWCCLVHHRFMFDSGDKIIFFVHSRLNNNTWHLSCVSEATLNHLVIKHLLNLEYKGTAFSVCVGQFVFVCLLGKKMD